MRFRLLSATPRAWLIPFLGSEGMPTPRKVPSVDFTKIPEECIGFWVVLGLGDDQVVLSQAESPRAAMRLSKADPNDPTIVPTQVPEVPTAARMKPPGEW